MRKFNWMWTLIFLMISTIVSCNETDNPETKGGLGQPCYTNGTCNQSLTCVADICVDESDQEKKDDTDDESTDNSKPDTETPDKEVNDDNSEEGDCNTESIGESCSLDNECGKCNICVKSKCIKGCISDDDCKMYSGLKCNKKLSRCTNVYATNQACGETKCPAGCCYANTGLTELKCLTEPAAAKCGLCANGEIFNGTECIPAVCSTTSDQCATLNSSESDSDCYECKSGEFICKKGSNCSSGVLVNAATCIPAGQKCVAGISECCSGMPCVEGYCY